MDEPFLKEIGHPGGDISTESNKDGSDLLEGGRHWFMPQFEEIVPQLYLHQLCYGAFRIRDCSDADEFQQVELSDNGNSFEFQKCASLIRWRQESL